MDGFPPELYNLEKTAVCFFFFGTRLGVNQQPLKSASLNLLEQTSHLTKILQSAGSVIEGSRVRTTGKPLQA